VHYKAEYRSLHNVYDHVIYLRGWLSNT